MLRDDLLHLSAQASHLIISINVIKELDESDPVKRGKGLIVTPVELASNLVDEIPEHGHQRS